MGTLWSPSSWVYPRGGVFEINGLGGYLRRIRSPASEELIDTSFPRESRVVPKRSLVRPVIWFRSSRTTAVDGGFGSFVAHVNGRARTIYVGPEKPPRWSKRSRVTSPRVDAQRINRCVGVRFALKTNSFTGWKIPRWVFIVGRDRGSEQSEYLLRRDPTPLSQQHRSLPPSVPHS